MKTTYFRLAVAAIFISLSACEQVSIPKPATGPSIDYSSHPHHAQYQQTVNEYRLSNGIPGAVLLLKKADEPVWIGAAGFSNLEHQTAMQANTPFRAGSITKTFVATAVLLLCEEKKLTLDDKLADLLPDVKGKIPKAEGITLRHLLSHTSGIFDPTNEDIQYQLDLVNNPDRRYARSDEQILQRYVYGRALNFEPGEQFGYSNSNYLLIGKILERKTGKTLQSVLSELILAPLGLTHTYLEKRNDPNLARGYADFYANKQLMDVTALDRAEAEGSAYGGLISTAADLHKFSEALFGEKLVKAASLKEMMTPYPVRKGETTYGLAVDQWSSDVLGIGFGNNGTLTGAEANVYYFPQKKATFVLFANYGTGTRKDFLNKVLR